MLSVMIYKCHFLQDFLVTGIFHMQAFANNFDRLCFDFKCLLLFLGAKNKFSVECLVTAWLFATLTLTSISSRSKVPLSSFAGYEFEHYECIKGTKATLTRLHILYQIFFIIVPRYWVDSYKIICRYTLDILPEKLCYFTIFFQTFILCFLGESASVTSTPRLLVMCCVML